MKNKYPIEAKDPLPDIAVDFIEVLPLAEKLREFEQKGCINVDGKESLVLVDLREGNYISDMKQPPAIETSCRTEKVLLDDLLNPDIRQKIPYDTEVITITETGNRDEFAIRYLSKFGYNNIRGLKFGMRDWLKHRLPLQK